MARCGVPGAAILDRMIALGRGARAQPSGRAFQGPAAPCSGPGAPPALPPRRVARAARAREFPEDVDERLGTCCPRTTLPRVASGAGSPVPGSDALAHRDSPCAGPRSLPSSAWSRVAFPYSRLPEKGTNLVTWLLGRRDDQEEDEWIISPGSGYPAMPVAPRRALPISRAGGRPKGGGRVEI